LSTTEKPAPTLPPFVLEAIKKAAEKAGK